jgi:hypothetical protein
MKLNKTIVNFIKNAKINGSQSPFGSLIYNIYVKRGDNAALSDIADRFNLDVDALKDLVKAVSYIDKIDKTKVKLDQDSGQNELKKVRQDALRAGKYIILDTDVTDTDYLVVSTGDSELAGQLKELGLNVKTSATNENKNPFGIINITEYINENRRINEDKGTSLKNLLDLLNNEYTKKAGLKVKEVVDWYNALNIPDTITKYMVPRNFGDNPDRLNDYEALVMRAQQDISEMNDKIVLYKGDEDFISWVDNSSAKKIKNEYGNKINKLQDALKLEDIQNLKTDFKATGSNMFKTVEKDASKGIFHIKNWAFLKDSQDYYIGFCYDWMDDSCKDVLQKLIDML